MQIALELAKVCLYFRVRFHSKLVLFTHVIIFLCLEKRVQTLYLIMLSSNPLPYYA